MDKNKVNNCLKVENHNPKKHISHIHPPKRCVYLRKTYTRPDTVMTIHLAHKAYIVGRGSKTLSKDHLSTLKWSSTTERSSSNGIKVHWISSKHFLSLCSKWWSCTLHGLFLSHGHNSSEKVMEYARLCPHQSADWGHEYSPTLWKGFTSSQE